MIFFTIFDPKFDFGALVVVFVIVCIVTYFYEGHGEQAGEVSEPEWDAEQKRDWTAHDREKRYWKAIMDRQDKPKRYYLDDLWRL